MCVGSETSFGTSADPDVVPVLDAANLGQFAFQMVIERFHEVYGDDAPRVAFSQVWLAGPTVERTFRIDRK